MARGALSFRSGSKRVLLVSFCSHGFLVPVVAIFLTHWRRLVGSSGEVMWHFCLSNPGTWHSSFASKYILLCFLSSLPHLSHNTYAFSHVNSQSLCPLVWPLVVHWMFVTVSPVIDQWGQPSQNLPCSWLSNSQAAFSILHCDWSVTFLSGDKTLLRTFQSQLLHTK